MFKVELEKRTGEPVFVDLDDVRYMTSVRFQGRHHYTMLRFDRKPTLAVKEEPEIIRGRAERRQIGRMPR